MHITLDSSLSLVSLDIHKDKKNYIVEASGEFYEMPEICIDAIYMIQNGKSLRQIENKLSEKYPTEEVDLLDFAKQLIELSLVSDINGETFDSHEKKEGPSGFLWIPQVLGKSMFNKLTYIVYIGLFIANFVIFFFHPNLFPHYRDIFIFHIFFLNIPVWLVLSAILVFVHEYGHVLAIRSFNLPTKLEVGHRLFLIVLETDMSAAWKLASKERNGLYLAGMCWDSLVLFLVLVSQLLFPGISGILLSVLHFVVFNTFIRMVYQCCIYMKTDLYYVFENVTGCYNLMENAQALLRKRIPFVKDSNDGEVIFQGEKRTVLFYSVFYFAGIGLSISLVFFYYIPQLLFSLKKIVPGFISGPLSLSFWDATIFTLQVLLVLWLLLRSWRIKFLQE